MAFISRKIITFSRRPLITAGLVLTVSMLPGCDLAQNQLKMDRSSHMEFQDYRDALAPRLAESDLPREPGWEDDIPALQPYVAAPSESLRPMPLVSISINQTVPLRDALFELANQAGYDIELDPNIRGSVIYTARNRPFDVVIERISNIAGLRYSFDDGSVRMEIDNPYQRTYKIDYLNYVRQNASSIRNDVSVVSGEGANTGSSFEASSESEADFWGELTVNLEQIVGAPLSRGRMITDLDPQITAAPTRPAPVAPVVVDPGDGNGQPQVQVQTPQAVLQVQPLPTGLQDGQQQTEAAAAAIGPRFSVNRQAGMISVFASERTHREVEDYLRQLKRSVTSQVLIEAKVLEVQLSDEFSTGINWNAMNLFGGRGRIGFDILGASLMPPLQPDLSPPTQMVAEYFGGDFEAAIQAISRFGTVRALASPRLTVLNNQTAALNVANNLVYFEIDIDITRDDFGTQTQIDSSIRNVPEGVLINVQPSINLDERLVSMSVRPTITRVLEFVNDPAVTLAVASAGLDTSISSPVPVVNVQEMDSVINMRSGEAIVMGGLLQDRATSERQGVPVLSEVPLFGGLFRTQVDQVEKTELVIFLKATIIEGGDSIHQTDRDLYRRFSQDRRPLDF